MQVIKNHIPIGHLNNPGVNRTDLRAMVFHYTANDKPRADDRATADYFARPFVWLDDGKPYETVDGVHPALDRKGQPISFRYGSTHIIADMDSVTEALPTTSASWAVGDRPLPYENGFKGQQAIAKHLFNHQQNYQTINIEICNNDALPHSDDDWWKACMNAAAWAVEKLVAIGYRVDLHHSLLPQTIHSPADLKGNSILLLRHFDITGKRCPAPFLGPGQTDWENFVVDIARQVHDRSPGK